MTVAQQLLPEFDHEMQGTRRGLERIPWDRSSFQPHPRSYSLGDLADHLATIPSWIAMTFETPELDYQTVPPRSLPASTAELVERFDAGVARSREALLQATDEAALAPWTFRNGGHVIFTLPRIVVLRSFVFSHLIHHRGQLTVYLRLLDVPVPALYGPSADEA